MKKIIVGAALFVSGIIGIAAVIVSCAILSASYNGVGQGLLSIMFDGLNGFNLAFPFILSIFLMLFGVVFTISGFRDRD